MLKKLILKNFQIHKHLKVEFDPKITTIVGVTNVGKTSIIRALRWLSHNRPSGRSFIRRGQDSCSVILYVDGERVSMAKGKVPIYSIGTKKFKAVGTKVPGQIQNILKLEDINYQHQLDPLFWIVDSPSQISQHLNEIIDLSSIDKGQKYLASEIRQSKTLVSVLGERVQSAKAKIKELNWTRKASSELRYIEGISERANELARKIACAESAIADSIKYRRSAKAASDGHSATSAAILAGGRMAESAKRLSRAEELLKQVSLIRRAKCQASQNLKDAEAEIHNLTTKKPCPVCGKMFS